MDVGTGIDEEEGLRRAAGMRRRRGWRGWGKVEWKENGWVVERAEGRKRGLERGRCACAGGGGGGEV